MITMTIVYEKHVSFVLNERLETTWLYKVSSYGGTILAIFHLLHLTNQRIFTKLGNSEEVLLLVHFGLIDSILLSLDTV